MCAPGAASGEETQATVLDAGPSRRGLVGNAPRRRLQAAVPATALDADGAAQADAVLLFLSGRSNHVHAGGIDMKIGRALDQLARLVHSRLRLAKLVTT